MSMVARIILHLQQGNKTIHLEHLVNNLVTYIGLVAITQVLAAS